MTSLLLMPAFVVAVAYLLGLGACERPDTAAVSRICSPIGLLSLAAVLGGSAFVVFVLPIRSLQRALAVDDKPKPAKRAASLLPEELLGKKANLSPGQELIVGRVDSCSRSGRVMVIGGRALTFWSLYPFQQNWIAEGDDLVTVHQKIPFNQDLKFALAFWNGPPNPVRGVAAISQSLSILIAAACVVLLAMAPAPYPAIWISVCILTFVICALYLVLMLRARAALRAFLRDAGCKM